MRSKGGQKEAREPTLNIWWEQVMELDEEDGDEGPFLGWDNLRGDAANMGWKNGVNLTDPREHHVDHPDPGCDHSLP